MKVLIVEDETAAYENLVDIIAEMTLSIEIVGNTESINQTVFWLQNHPAPDLLLMDIHLSDGSAFAIFERITVETPVIFITAYDEYAIEAFKVNSIDYLLKPIKADELKKAVIKFSKWTGKEIIPHLTQVKQLALTPRYKNKLLVPFKDQLLPIAIKDVSCFYTTDKSTRIYMNNGEYYSYSKTLELIFASLNPNDFIRANKQFIIARESIKNITIWFDNRLLVNLGIETPEQIYISKNKAAEFKEWIVNAQ